MGHLSNRNEVYKRSASNMKRYDVAARTGPDRNIRRYMLRRKSFDRYQSAPAHISGEPRRVKTVQRRANR